MARFHIALGFVLTALGGCAATSQYVDGKFVPARAYRQQDCAEIHSDLKFVQLRLTELASELDSVALINNTFVGVGLIAFWPALLAVRDTKPLSAEYSRYKGWAAALVQAQSNLECTARVSLPSAALD